MTNDIYLSVSNFVDQALPGEDGNAKETSVLTIQEEEQEQEQEEEDEDEEVEEEDDDDSCSGGTADIRNSANSGNTSKKFFVL